MVRDVSFFNTQLYKIRIKGKVELSREKSSALPLYFGVVAIEKGTFLPPLTMDANFTYFIGLETTVIVIEGDPKAPFSIATTPRCRAVRYSFPWIALLYPWYVPYNGVCEASWLQVPFFESLVWLDQGLNPSFPDHRQTQETNEWY